MIVMSLLGHAIRATQACDFWLGKSSPSKKTEKSPKNFKFFPSEKFFLAVYLKRKPGLPVLHKASRNQLIIVAACRVTRNSK
jgi:hypothetical protein